MGSDLILVIVVGTALAFDFTNGFHDTANVVATSISTRAVAPRVAVGFAAVMNFVGATLVAAGADAVMGEGLVSKVLIPALIAPVLAFSVAGLAILVAYRAVGPLRPGPVNRGFRLGQLLSGGLLALAHGTNDAQKTMGVITLALVANGNISANDVHVPTWVVVTSASAIALGTYSGGWRIIRTMGMRIIKMDPAQGFSAQSAGASVITSKNDWAPVFQLLFTGKCYTQEASLFRPGHEWLTGKPLLRRSEKFPTAGGAKGFDGITAYSPSGAEKS